MHLVLIPAQRLPHIQRVLAIIIVILHLAIHTIPHLAIQLLGHAITLPHKQIHKPRVRRVASLLETRGERGRVAEAACAGGHGERGYVAVPGEVVWVGVCGGGVGVYGGWEGRGFEFA